LELLKLWEKERGRQRRKGGEMRNSGYDGRGSDTGLNTEVSFDVIMLFLLVVRRREREIAQGMI